MVRGSPDRRFHELFEGRVRQHPRRGRRGPGRPSLDLRELNVRASRIAWFTTAGCAREDVVAVVTGRTLEWLAAVDRRPPRPGDCYLPSNRRSPAGRIATVLARSGSRWVLAERGVPHLDAALAGRPGVERAFLDDVLAEDRPEDDPALPVAADQLAYIYFTSGSTGEPKGAMCEHAGFLNHLYAKIEDLGMAEGEVVAQTRPACF
ncbi:AMP-binding protein [Streptomyces tricolor]|nr:AMP-binding protein [Streptomyces tricolor]